MIDIDTKRKIAADICARAGDDCEFNGIKCPNLYSDDVYCLDEFHIVENMPDDDIKILYQKFVNNGWIVDENDNVNHPSHYTQGGMETIDEMILVFGKMAVRDYCLCNAWKYRARAIYKNGEEDMQKSHWYLQKYKELCEELNTETNNGKVYCV